MMRIAGILGIGFPHPPSSLMFPEVQSNLALYTEENAFPTALDNVIDLILARLNTVSM